MKILSILKRCYKDEIGCHKVSTCFQGSSSFFSMLIFLIGAKVLFCGYCHLGFLNSYLAFGEKTGAGKEQAKYDLI